MSVQHSLKAIVRRVKKGYEAIKHRVVEWLLPVVCWGRYTKGDRHGYWWRLKLHSPGRWFYFLWPDFRDFLKSEILPRKEKGFQ